MSPALLSHARARRFRLRHLVVAAVAAAGTFGAVAPAAHAAVTTLAFTDPAGDAQGFDTLDLTAGSVTYDDAAGTLSVSFTTKAPIATYPYGAVVQVGIGQSTSTGCTTDLQDGTNAGMFYLGAGPSVGNTAVSVWSIPGTSYGGNGSVSPSGNTVTMAPTDDTAGNLKGLKLTCAYFHVIGTGATTDDPTVDADSATALVQSGSTNNPTNNGGGKSNTQLAPVTAPVTTTGLDTDGDGTADSADACPTVAGAQKNGCPTMPAALEVRLGARRVVVDRLQLRTTATTCPKLVRIHVTAKGKLIGNGVVTTSQFGRFCRVNGVIKTKKTVKAVRVTMTSPGLTSLAKSAHR